MPLFFSARGFRCLAGLEPASIPSRLRTVGRLAFGSCRRSWFRLWPRLEMGAGSGAGEAEGERLKTGGPCHRRPRAAFIKA